MPRLKTITLDSLDRHLPEILRSEEEFPPSLRETAETYREAMGCDRAFCLMLFEGDDYVGNATGFGIQGAPYRDYRIDEFRPMDAGVVYLYNIVTLSVFQGKGYGKLLLEAFGERAKAEGFSVLAGHFRDNGSLKNFKASGGQVIGAVDDWFGTGETYYYCEKELCGAGDNSADAEAPSLQAACSA